MFDTVSLLDLQKRRSLLQERTTLQSRIKALESSVEKAGFGGTGKANGIRQRYDEMSALLQQKTNLQETVEKLQEQYEKSLAAQALLKKKEAVATDLLSKVSERYVTSLDEQLNEIYAFIYRNEGKSIKLEIKEFRGKMTIQLNIITKTGDAEYTESYDDEGHSVSVVLGVIFLVYFIVQNDLPRVVFFDETFGGLDPVTLDRFFPFLRAFSDKLGFEFAFVSHDVIRIEQYMDRVYTVTQGVYALTKDLTKEGVSNEA